MHTVKTADETPRTARGILFTLHLLRSHLWYLTSNLIHHPVDHTRQQTEWYLDKEKNSFKGTMFERSSKTSGKPNMTYVELIKRAIERSPTKALSVSEIYASIEGSHPFFRTSTKGWKNTVRHLLSLTPCFVNNARLAPLSGKGGLWTIDPEASDTACRKRTRSSPADRPLTTAALIDRSSSNVRTGQTPFISNSHPNHTMAGLGYHDVGYPSSNAGSGTRYEHIQSQPGTTLSASPLSPSSTSSSYGVSPQKSSLTLDSMPTSFTFEVSNSIKPHQKHDQPLTGIYTSKLSDPVRVFNISEIQPVRNTLPDRSLITASSSLDNRCFRPLPAPQLSSTSNPSNTTYLAPLDWPSNGPPQTVYDHAYPMYGSGPALELRQNVPLIASSLDPNEYPSSSDSTLRRNHSPSDKRSISAEHRSIHISSASSLSLALHSPPLPSPSYSQDSYENRRDDDSLTSVAYEEDDHTQWSAPNVQDRRSKYEQNEERKLHSLSFKSMPTPGPNQHLFQLPSPSSSLSRINPLQRSPHTIPHALNTFSSGSSHPPYYHHHHPVPQPHLGIYGISMDQSARQDRFNGR